jgi:hypothetical protein
VAAAVVVHRRWKRLRAEHLSYFICAGLHFCSERIGERNFSPPTRTVVIDRPSRHGLPRHFFETKGLRTKLQIVMLAFTF